jgi:hypothetical protein
MNNLKKFLKCYFGLAASIVFINLLVWLIIPKFIFGYIVLAILFCIPTFLVYLAIYGGDSEND